MDRIGLYVVVTSYLVDCIYADNGEEWTSGEITGIFMACLIFLKIVAVIASVCYYKFRKKSQQDTEFCVECPPNPSSDNMMEPPLYSETIGSLPHAPDQWLAPPPYSSSNEHDMPPSYEEVARKSETNNCNDDITEQNHNVFTITESDNDDITEQNHNVFTITDLDYTRSLALIIPRDEHTEDTEEDGILTRVDL